ncbi:conserved hypothetical protein [Microbacterium sp. C448]|nr:conserved hypothetical protein [Microbacterium sp. C448]
MTPCHRSQSQLDALPGLSGRNEALLPTVLADWWGFFYQGWIMADRVAVFIDYENAHRTGHGLFGGVGQPKYETVLDPLKVAEALVSKRRFAGELTDVWVFRGRPVPEHQPKPASSNDLQAEAWSEDERVHVIRRDLKYDFWDDGTFTAREKGIDVALAVGLTEGALDGAFDVAIVFSGDTDLLPALELVFRRHLAKLEIATWSGAKPLWFADFLRQTPPRHLPFCHFLNEADFLALRDYSAVDE